MENETVNTHASVAESQKPEQVIISQDKKKEDPTLLTAENCIINPVQSFGMYNTLIYKNMEFIDKGKELYFIIKF